MSMKIGIIGNGFVGKATKVLECDLRIESNNVVPDLGKPTKKNNLLWRISSVDLLFLIDFCLLKNFL